MEQSSAAAAAAATADPRITEVLRFLENLHGQTEDLRAKLLGDDSTATDHTEESEYEEGETDCKESTGDETTEVTEDSTSGAFDLQIVKTADGDSFKLEYISCDNDEVRDEIIHKVRRCDWASSPVVMMNLKSDFEKKDGFVKQMTEKELKQQVKKQIAKKDWKGLNAMMERVNRTTYPMGDIVFGQLGEQVEVMKPLKTRVLLMLSGRETTSFKFLPMKNPKYTLNVTPSEGTLSYLGTRAVIVTIKLCLQCTTSVVVDLPVVFCRGSKSDQEKLLRNKDYENSKLCKCMIVSKLQGMVSTYLDLDELVIYAPPLGEGRFSRVFGGKYRGIDIACKLFKSEEYETEYSRKTRNREVAMFEALRHPCIVNFIGATLVDGAYTITTELCPYGSLTIAMKKHQEMWPMTMKMKALQDCAYAMDFLHRSSIIHRGLKPDNLLVVSLDFNSPVVCKLSDFGTTKGINPMVHNISHTKAIGCGFYTAPEIMDGKVDYTNKVDVYSFGIMIASVVDNCLPPYHNIPEARNQLKFYPLLMKGARPIVSNIGDMPLKLKTLMEHCWDSDPDKRPSFERILACLNELLDREPCEPPKSPSPSRTTSGQLSPPPSTPKSPSSGPRGLRAPPG